MSLVFDQKNLTPEFESAAQAKQNKPIHEVYKEQILWLYGNEGTCSVPSILLEMHLDINWVQYMIEIIQN